MTTMSSIWIDKDDATFIEQCFVFGLRQLGRETGIDVSFISRWLRGYTGMAEDKAKKIIKLIYHIGDEGEDAYMEHTNPYRGNHG